MQRHSIFFKINIFFAVAIIGVVLAMLIMFKVGRSEQINSILLQAPHIMKTIRMARLNSDERQLVDLLEGYHYDVVAKAEHESILKESRSLRNESPKRQKHFDILERHRHVYLHINVNGTDLLFEKMPEHRFKMATVLIVLSVILVLLVVMYIAIVNTIKPIKNLKDEMMKYGEGVRVNTRSSKKDEIALVGNAFQDSIEKIQSLTDARKLFLRNIIHELNTPITKGKLVAELIEDEHKERLEGIFKRLEQLVKEMADVEKVTSEHYVMAFKAYRIADILDDAFEKLFLEQERCEARLESPMLHCDFNMMSIVFKNLIDNALKYGKNLHVKSDEKHVSFCSEGEPLRLKMSDLQTPYLQEHESHYGGYGLGLYIVSEILKRQEMQLHYEHENGVNCFCIIKRVEV
jgi:two-component system OmpR family sensor kinase